MDVISIIIDVVIMTLLVGTIFYAIQLSSQLKMLKESRADLQNLLDGIGQNITKATDTMAEMKDLGNDVGEHLQGLIAESRGLSEEMHIILEAGENLTERLERGAEKAGRALKHSGASSSSLLRSKLSYSDIEFQDDPTRENYDDKDDNYDDYDDYEPRQRQKSSLNVRMKKPKDDHVPLPRFMIRDPELESNVDYDLRADKRRNTRIESRSEQGLASALRNKSY